jgi:DNA-binding response OmpR family regulator
METAKVVNLLLVDDHPGNLLALQSILERLGHTMILAHSGREALRCMLKDDFAVILLDVQMPEMDGFEIAALARSQLRTRYCPIIFLTALGKSENEMSRGYEVGGMDYLLKPFNSEVLRSKVKILVELYQNTSSIKHRNAELVAANSGMKVRLNERMAALEECGRNLTRSNKELAGLRGAVGT